MSDHLGTHAVSALRFADDLMNENDYTQGESSVSIVRTLIAIAYLKGTMDGSEETIALMRAELREVMA